MTDTSATTETTTATPAVQPVQLNVQDLINATILLKVAIERGGTFKAEEMAEVSAVYSKMNAFAQYVQATAQAESQAAANETKTVEEGSGKKHKKSKKQ